MTGPHKCFMPIPVLIAQVNQQVRGWGAYFDLGYPRCKKKQYTRDFVLSRLIGYAKI